MWTARLIEAIAGRVPVGSVGFGPEPVPMVAVAGLRGGRARRRMFHPVRGCCLNADAAAWGLAGATSPLV